MKTVKSVATTKGRVSRLLGAAFGLFAGCGDVDVYKINPGDIESSEVPTDHSCFIGSAVELVRHSSTCEQTSQPIAAEVHDGTLFSADQTEALQSPCADGPTPRFEVIFDESSRSIYLDFSQITQGDRFPASVFEGYVFEVVLEEPNGYLLAVEVDREMSTLDLDATDLDWDTAHIELNFEGVAYDPQSVLKLDLLFAHLSPLPS